MCSYTKEDKDILVKILKTHEIIENKQADATTIKKKQEAWVQVASEYNAVRLEKRTVLQLKRCWDKIKRHRKLTLAEERLNRMSGGAGDNHKLILPDIPVGTHTSTYEFDNDAQFIGDSADETDSLQALPETSHRKPNGGNSNVNSLMDIRIKNAQLERKQMIELHEIRMEIEREKLEKAILEKELFQQKYGLK